MQTEDSFGRLLLQLKMSQSQSAMISSQPCRVSFVGGSNLSLKFKGVIILGSFFFSILLEKLKTFYATGTQSEIYEGELL